MCFSTIQASPTAFQFVYVALAIDVTDGCDLSNKVHHELLMKKLGNVAYFPVHPAVKNCLPAVHIFNKMKSLAKF